MIHRFGDGCPGGHRIEDGGVALTPSQMRRAVIEERREERISALEGVAETLKATRAASHPNFLALEACPCMTCVALLRLEKAEED